ncbi:hypothetical protein CspHIS471_0700680 [Cutaneotrichosporon sp. HIS471]|nr:hypothetical protein CspHIS471_0700680 [Cutaneotrichosporon sp. HIS471]
MRIGGLLTIPLIAAVGYTLLSHRRDCPTPKRVDVEIANAWQFDNPSRVGFERPVSQRLEHSVMAEVNISADTDTVDTSAKDTDTTTDTDTSAKDTTTDTDTSVKDTTTEASSVNVGTSMNNRDADALNPVTVAGNPLREAPPCYNPSWDLGVANLVRSSSSGIPFGSPEPFESQKGDIIGGVIGSVVAIHLLAAAAWFFLYQRRKARRSKVPKTPVDTELNTLPIEPPPVVPSASPSIPARKVVFKPSPPKSSGSHTVSSSSTLVAPSKARMIPRADV